MKTTEKILYGYGTPRYFFPLAICTCFPVSKGQASFPIKTRCMFKETHFVFFFVLVCFKCQTNSYREMNFKMSP